MKLVLKSINFIQEKTLTASKQLLEGRSNIVNTIANKLRIFLTNKIVSTDIDPKEKFIVDLKEFKKELLEISPKLRFDADSLEIELTDVDDSLFEKGSAGSYDTGSKVVKFKFPIGYSSVNYVSPGNFDKKLQAFQKQLNTAESDIETAKSKKNFGKLESAERKSESIKRQIENLIFFKNICTPNSQERLKAVKQAFRKKKFSTLFHELVHARQYTIPIDKKTGEEITDPKDGKTIEPPRKNQLNNLFHGKRSSVANEDIFPIATPTNYTTMQSFMYTKGGADASDPLERFFYLSRPIEIDARIKEAKLFYNNLRKVDRKTAIDKTYDHIIDRENNHVKQIDMLTRTIPEIFSNELKIKLLYKYFLQMSMDDKEFFTKTPKFNEKLNELKAKVDEINSKITSLTTKASPRDMEIYKYYSLESRYPREEPTY